MKIRFEIILLIIIVIQLFILPFAPYVIIAYLALFNAVLLFIVAITKLLGGIKALYLVLLGYGLLAFFDIFKFSVMLENVKITDSHLDTVYWIYISFTIFLISYILTNVTRRFQKKSVVLSMKRLKIIVLPIALISIGVLFLNTSDSPIMLLISFFPKALTVLFFYQFVVTKQYKYLSLTIILFLMSFSEISRRVYITFFFILLPIIMSFVHIRYKKIKNSYKFLFASIFIFIYIFMNTLRSDFQFGKGYVQGDKLTSTINYMMQFRAIDTFDNTAFVIENIPDEYDYYYGETYLAILVQFIPRSIWEDKPVSFGAPLGLLKKAGIREFSIDKWKNIINAFSYSPGFLGEAYANFGFTGIIILSMLFGIISKVYDLNINTNEAISDVNILPYLAFLSSFFLILRGDMLMATYYSILFFLFLKLIIFISKRRI